MTCPCWRWQLGVPEQCWICIMFFFAGRMPFTIIPLMSFRVSGSNTIFILCVPWPMVNQRSRKRHREESADADAQLAEGVICKSVGRLPPNAPWPWSWLCFLVSICVWNIYKRMRTPSEQNWYAFFSINDLIRVFEYIHTVYIYT